jgi:hypothetical protein
MERLEQRRHLAAAVGGERDVIGEEMRQPVPCPATAASATP